MTDLLGIGLTVVVKVDGERDRQPWTVVVTGAPLGDHFVRVDAADADSALVRALAQLRPLLPAPAVVDEYLAS